MCYDLASFIRMYGAEILYDKKMNFLTVCVAGVCALVFLFPSINNSMNSFWQ